MAARLPASIKKLVATKITNKFREAVELTTVPLPKPGPKEVLVKNRYVGINASDINHTAGRYDSSMKPPFDTGFEGVGEIVSIGSDCKNIKVGQPVAYMKFGSYAEYTVCPANVVFPVPSVQAKYMPLLVSGLTASICLDKVGELNKGETVLITAAAGGTGQFATQIAKNAGCHVIGTCSSDDKVEFLKSIGCDRPINYKKENLRDVLKKEYPKGIDVVYESIGGEIFDTCLDRLANHGRLVVIGFISGYESQSGMTPLRMAGLPAKLLTKSASVRGFLLFHYHQYFAEHFQKLITMVNDNTLQSIVDLGDKTQSGRFVGLNAINNAVEYMYQRSNVGKIVVELPEGSTSQL